MIFGAVYILIFESVASLCKTIMCGYYNDVNMTAGELFHMANVGRLCAI